MAAVGRRAAHAALLDEFVQVHEDVVLGRRIQRRVQVLVHPPHQVHGRQRLAAALVQVLHHLAWFSTQFYRFIDFSYFPDQMGSTKRILFSTEFPCVWLGSPTVVFLLEKLLEPRAADGG